MPLMSVAFHPIDRPKLERWARTFEYHYVIDTSAMGNGYSVANMQIGHGERVYEIKRRMAEYGIRVFERPGVVMKVASSEPVDRGMEFGGMERLRAAIGLVESRDEFKANMASPGAARMWLYSDGAGKFAWAKDLGDFKKGTGADRGWRAANYEYAPPAGYARQGEGLANDPVVRGARGGAAGLAKRIETDYYW